MKCLKRMDSNQYDTTLPLKSEYGKIILGRICHNL